MKRQVISIGVNRITGHKKTSDKEKEEDRRQDRALRNAPADGKGRLIQQHLLQLTEWKGNWSRIYKAIGESRRKDVLESETYDRP